MFVGEVRCAIIGPGLFLEVVRGKPVVLLGHELVEVAPALAGDPAQEQRDRSSARLRRPAMGTGWLRRISERGRDEPEDQDGQGRGQRRSGCTTVTARPRSRAIAGLATICRKNARTPARPTRPRCGRRAAAAVSHSRRRRCVTQSRTRVSADRVEHARPSVGEEGEGDRGCVTALRDLLEARPRRRHARAPGVGPRGRRPAPGRAGPASTARPRPSTAPGRPGRTVQAPRGRRGAPAPSGSGGGCRRS